MAKKKTKNEKLMTLRSKQRSIICGINNISRDIPIDNRLEILNLMGEINKKIDKVVELYQKAI